MNAHAALLPSLTQWSDRLAFDIALCLEGNSQSVDEVKERYQVSADKLLVFSQDRTFLRKVGDYRKEIRDKGMTFRLKARAQADDLLTTSYLMIHDQSVSPAVKADLIKSTVKWADLEPKNNDIDAGVSGGVRININLGNGPEDIRVIDATPRLSELDGDDDADDG